MTGRSPAHFADMLSHGWGIHSRCEARNLVETAGVVVPPSYVDAAYPSPLSLRLQAHSPSPLLDRATETGCMAATLMKMEIAFEGEDVDALRGMEGVFRAASKASFNEFWSWVATAASLPDAVTAMEHVSRLLRKRKRAA